MTIYYFNALAGAGKTRALAHEAHRLASRGRKLLFTQPTKLLIDKTITDEFGPLMAKYPIRAIHGDTEPSVISKIVAHIQQSRDGEKFSSSPRPPSCNCPTLSRRTAGA